MRYLFGRQHWRTLALASQATNHLRLRSGKYLQASNTHLQPDADLAWLFFAQYWWSWYIYLWGSGIFPILLGRAFQCYQWKHHQWRQYDSCDNPGLRLNRYFFYSDHPWHYCSWEWRCKKEVPCKSWYYIFVHSKFFIVQRSHWSRLEECFSM